MLLGEEKDLDINFRISMNLQVTLGVSENAIPLVSHLALLGKILIYKLVDPSPTNSGPTNICSF